MTRLVSLEEHLLLRKKKQLLEEILEKANCYTEVLKKELGILKREQIKNIADSVIEDWKKNPSSNNGFNFIFLVAER